MNPNGSIFTNHPQTLPGNAAAVSPVALYPARKSMSNFFSSSLMAAAVGLSSLLFLPSADAFEAVDDFESYGTGAVAAASGGVWTPLGNEANSAIQQESGNKVLTYGAGGSQGAFRSLGAHSLGADASGTYFLRFRANSTTIDNSLGFTDIATPTGFGSYKAQIAVRGPSGTPGIRLGVRSGSTVTDYVTDLQVATWYNLWLVVNNGWNSYDLYFSEGYDDGQLLASGLSYRDGQAAGDLIAMLLVGNAGALPLSIDDVYFTLGAVTTNPIEEPAELLITQHPANATAVVGGDVSFTAAAVGGGVREFQWQVSTDGGVSWGNISGATSTTYTISPVAYAANENQYRAVVTSGAQTATTNAATLTVNYPPPTITQSIANANVAQGSSHTFTIGATGLGTLTYEWRKDGAVLPQTGASVTVSNAQAANTGTYSVTVFDHAGTADGLPATSVTRVAGLYVYPASQTVFMNRNDALNENPTSFNSGLGWADGLAPVAGKDYMVDGHVLRTPPTGESYTFAGSNLVSFTAVQTGVGGVAGTGRIMYKGTGTGGTITIPSLVLNGGSLEHLNGQNDIFRLAGNLHVIGDSQIWSKQGPTFLDGVVSGYGTIRNPTSDTVNCVLVFANPNNTFRGSIVNNGRFRLEEGAVMNFVIGASGRSNSISGGGAQTILNGVLVLDLTNAGTTVGDSWGLVIAGNRSYGETFEVAGFERHGNFWIAGEYLFDQGTGRLSVIDPTAPRFLQQPANVTALVGDTITLNSLAYSEATLTYQWEFSADGVAWTEIQNATDASLTIEAAPYAARGQYRVTAESSGQSLTSNAATLTLTFGPPRILQGITSATVREGDPHAFVVIAEGVGNLTYEWTKDDVLQPAVTGPTFDLGTVAASDAGTYTVTITDDAAVAEGLSATSVTLSAVLRTFEAPPAGRAISLNFVGTSTGGAFSPDLGVIAPEESAGVLAVSNWNNSAGVTGVASQTVPFGLAENTGTENAAYATWSSANTWASRTALAGKDADQRLFHGYIEGRGGSSVTISSIPYATYDVYVYPMGVEGPSGEWIRNVSLENATGAVTDLYGRNYSGNPPQPTIPFILGSATTVEAAQAAEPATFFRFAGVSGSHFTVRHADTAGNNLGGIAAISIVDTTPSGTGYPPLVTATPASRFIPAGGTVELSVTAVSQNDGGSLSYQWRRNGTLVGTGSSLTLTNITSAQTGAYTVTVTDSAAPGTPRTAEATLVVVDASRPALLSVDLQSGTHEPMFGHGILRTDGPVEVNPASPRDDIGLGGAVVGDTIWNGRNGATGSATYANFVDAAGLPLTGVTLAISGATGVEDAPTGGGIDTPIENFSGPLLRDYVFTQGDDEMTVTVGGLHAFVGKEVILVVYALGKDSAFWPPDGTGSDVSTVTLAGQNNFQGTAPMVTDQVEGRDLRYNNFAHAVFTANVAGNGTVSWTIGPVAGEPGLNAFNGFQMLVTNTGNHVTTTPIEDWRLAHFGTTENSGAAANTADFDGDGISNLLEYALGADPTVPGDAFGLILADAAGGFLSLAFAHIGDPTLTYQIEASSDLRAGWSVVHTYPPFNTDGVETYIDTVAIGDAGHRFVRMKVTAP